LGAKFIAREYNHLGHNYVLCCERYGFKVEDEFMSGIKSSCRGKDVSLELSPIDRCHITFASELLKVGIL